MTARIPSAWRSLCTWVIVVFGALYVAALALLAIGHFGFFGAARDPLAGVFLIPLGIPWIYLLDMLPIAANDRIWIGVFSPLINLVLLSAACRLVAHQTRLRGE